MLSNDSHGRAFTSTSLVLVVLVLVEVVGKEGFGVAAQLHHVYLSVNQGHREAVVLVMETDAPDLLR